MAAESDGTPEENGRLQRIKQHVKDNKKTYLVGGGCLIVGSLGGALYGSARPDVHQLVKVRQFMGIAYKCSQSTIVIAANGDPGDVVERVSDGMKWASKGELARALGINRNMVTRYFSGKLPNLLGEQYVILGKAGHEIPLS